MWNMFDCGLYAYNRNWSLVVQMNLRDWLIELANNYRWDIIDGEVVILPIKEDDN